MDYYMGQIVPIAFNFAPKFTAFCDGQTVPVSQNQALYTLLGNTFGGVQGQSIGLPDARGRTMTGFGTAGSVAALGSNGGEASHVLTTQEMPLHYHQVNVSTQGTAVTDPTGALPGGSTATPYLQTDTTLSLGAVPLSNVGTGAPHQNMQPSLSINFVMMLTGIFPPKN